MTKRLIALLMLVCMICGLLAACKADITADEALKIVREDLGEAAAKAEAPHVHSGTYENEDCYNIFVTVGDESLVYIISADGEILYKGHGNHSH